MVVFFGFYGFFVFLFACVVVWFDFSYSLKIFFMEAGTLTVRMDMRILVILISYFYDLKQFTDI